MSEVQSQSAPFLRNRISEQAHLLGLVAQVVRHPILGQDLLLAGHDRGPNEVPGLGEDLPEIFVADFSGGHRETPVQQMLRGSLVANIIYEI